MFHKRLTYLIGPEAQEIFFKASDDVLSQNEVYDFMQPVFGSGIVYDATKKNRQVQFQTMANGLRTSRLKAYVHKIEDETRKYLKQFWTKDEGEVDLLTALSELTILTASRCLHGEDVREHIFKEVQELYHDLDHGLTPVTVFWPNAPTEAHRKRNAAREAMVKLFTTVIEQRREHPERSDGTDILSLFMDIKYKDGSPVTMEQVTGLLIALLFAGQHTSCISSTWTTLWMANDPKFVDRLLAEQDKVLKGDRSKTLEYEDLQEMEFLHNCMREALRMCPTFIMILRRAEKDIPITVQGRKHVIPKGDFVTVSPTVSMRLKETFSAPDTFDPDRFAAPREEHKKPYSYLGFGGGLHSCMGQNFAFVQVKTILSILFREYEIERVAPEMPAIGYDDMVVGPKGDCTIRYKKRV
jgi:sterol 14-demethylase